MGLMYATGPFSRNPAGKFNFHLPRLGRGHALYLEPCAKRIRVIVGDEVVADSCRTMLLHESGHQPVHYFPPEDVRSELLEPSERHTRCPRKGEASYWTIRAGDRVVDAGAWYYADPIDEAPEQLRGMIAFYFGRMDRWLEEDEEIRGHPRDPYHRIDVRRSQRHVQVSLDGELLAETRRTWPLFETGLPIRWYMAREDVRVGLQESGTVTHCPYKGDASYLSAAVPGGEDLVWYYPDPMPDALAVKDLVCFWNERVDLSIDGETLERPESPWRHAA